MSSTRVSIRVPSKQSCYEIALRLGLIGCVDRAPADLSTGKRHLRGLGK